MANKLLASGISIKTTMGEVSLSDLPAGSVALDGCVRGPVMGDDQDRWSFDHHDDCHRLITAATCEQVWTATKLGFKWDNRDVWINDLDGDTVLSVFIILAAASTDTKQPEALGRLVRAVGLVDAHGPSASNLMDAEERFLVRAFYDGIIHPILGRNIQERFDEWDGLLSKCCTGIINLIDGTLEIPEVPAEPVEIIERSLEGSRLKVAIATCAGFGGFEKLYDQGFDVVILATEAAKGSTRYTIGKVSDLVRFDFPTLLEALNDLEKGWGGGSSIAGSPRLEGGESSHLLPKDVFYLATETVGKETQWLPRP